MLNECHAKVPPPWVAFDTIKVGEWFWTHNPTPGSDLAFPMFRIEGGYVSPANGFVCSDAQNCYDKVLRCPVGTEITIRVGTRSS